RLEEFFFQQCQHVRSGGAKSFDASEREARTESSAIHSRNEIHDAARRSEARKSGWRLGLRPPRRGGITCRVSHVGKEGWLSSRPRRIGEPVPAAGKPPFRGDVLEGGTDAARRGGGGVKLRPPRR